MKINVSVGWKTNLSDLLNGKTKNTAQGSVSCTKLCPFFFPVVSDEDPMSWKKKVRKKENQNQKTKTMKIVFSFTERLEHL